MLDDGKNDNKGDQGAGKKIDCCAQRVWVDPMTNPAAGHRFRRNAARGKHITRTVHAGKRHHLVIRSVNKHHRRGGRIVDYRGRL